ncbi:MAG: radical SAM protein [Clostridia bacterium]|nr:radical SAM protein [Clostridia bacterium]
MICKMCPHECGVDRKTKIGRCKAKEEVTLSLVSLHQFEEPCISVGNGSGTIFFSGCNLSCVYCQNSDISQDIKGKIVSIDRLANIFIEQQQRGAQNINLVTPSIYVYQIKEAIIKAKKKGLTIPIIYNSSGYDKVETLKELKGLIDIYLPDFKYASDKLGEKYSKVSNYSTIAKEAIKEMVRQVGQAKIDENGKLLSGVIIRHMILPNNILNTKQCLKWIKDNFGSEMHISIMAQYFPTNKVNEREYKEINRKLNEDELNKVKECICELEFENGYIQEIENDEEKYVPKFNCENV